MNVNECSYSLDAILSEWLTNFVLLVIFILVNLLDYLHIEKYRAWVLKAVDVWSGGIKPKQPVIVFTLRLLGLIGKEEQYFLRLTQDDVLGKVCKVLDVHRDELPASIKMAFNTMLSDFIGHKIGRAWVKMTGKN